MNQISKKLFIVHDNNKNEKNKISENNNLDLKNEVIDKIIETENIPKINDKNYEYKDIKENKGKLSLFTKSNIKMNADGLNNTNNNANNNTIIKFNNNNNDLLCEKIDDKSNNIQMNLKELSKNQKMR